MSMAYIYKGGKLQVMDTATGKVIREEPIQKPTPAEEKPKQETKQVIQEPKKQEKEEDIVSYCKQSIDNSSITYRVAASCIVGQIRAIYFTNLIKPNGYDLEILNYMDKILFNNLTGIIEGIIDYGSKAVSVDLVKQVIKNAIDAIEFQTDLKSIYKVIDRVYEEF
jgi:hypothetical protein